VPDGGSRERQIRDLEVERALERVRVISKLSNKSRELEIEIRDFKRDVRNLICHNVHTYQASDSRWSA